MIMGERVTDLFVDLKFHRKKLPTFADWSSGLLADTLVHSGSGQIGNFEGQGKMDE